MTCNTGTRAPRRPFPHDSMGTKPLSTIIDWLLGDRGSTVLAGALGGVVRWITLKESWKEGASSIIVGGIGSLYLTPLVNPAMSSIIGSFVVDEANRLTFSGFIVGLGGIAFTGFVIDFIKGWTKKVVHEEEGTGK